MLRASEAFHQGKGHDLHKKANNLYIGLSDNKCCISVLYRMFNLFTCFLERDS